MAKYKVNFYFTSGAQGWSETYYTEQATSSAALANAYNLLQARTPMFASPTVATFIRLSLEGTARSAILTAVGAGTLFPYPTTAYASNADRVSSAVLFRANTTLAGTTRPFYVRGNPDSVYDQLNPGNADANTWQTKATFWINVLTAPSNFWFVKRRVPKNSLALADIFTWVNESSPSFYSVFTTPKPTGLAVGDFLQIYGPTGLKPKASLFKVANVDETSANAAITVFYSIPNQFQYSHGAKWGKYVAGYEQIIAMQREQFVTRITGRPFAVTRGRRRSLHP